MYGGLLIAGGGESGLGGWGAKGFKVPRRASTVNVPGLLCKSSSTGLVEAHSRPVVRCWRRIVPSGPA